MTAAYDDMALHAARAGLPVTVLGWQSTGRFAGSTPIPEMLAWIEPSTPPP